MPSKEILQQHQLVRVTFELPPEVQGSIVHLVGDFTGWEGVPMKRSDEGGWTTTVDLAPGRSFEFRYLVDGERWENDWNADRYVRSPFGHDNSVVDTPALDAPETAVHQSAAAKKTAAKKPAAKKTAAKKQAVKKTAAKKAAAKKAASKPAAGGAAEKGATSKTATGTKGATRKAASSGAAGTAPLGGRSTAKSTARKPGSEDGPPRSAPEDGSRPERRDDTSGGR